jgi:hypothetical protein
MRIALLLACLGSMHQVEMKSATNFELNLIPLIPRRKIPNPLIVSCTLAFSCGFYFAQSILKQRNSSFIVKGIDDIRNESNELWASVRNIHKLIDEKDKTQSFHIQSKFDELQILLSSIESVGDRLSNVLNQTTILVDDLEERVIKLESFVESKVINLIDVIDKSFPAIFSRLIELNEEIVIIKDKDEDTLNKLKTLLYQLKKLVDVQKK